MMSPRLVAPLALVLGFYHNLAIANQSTTCKVINSIPTTITGGGLYCLQKNFFVNLNSGAAIQVNTNNAVIDFNGFRIQNSAGAATTANGVNAVNRKHIIVKNGMLRGFYYGVRLENLDLENRTNYIVENMRIDESWFGGIRTWGRGNVIRHNIVHGTGGTTTLVDPSGTGITSYGNDSRVVYNDIMDTTGSGTFGQATGILLVFPSDGAVVSDNRVSQTKADNNEIGIEIAGNPSDVLVTRNHVVNSIVGIAGISRGIDGNLASVICRDNTIRSFSTGFLCVDGGGNFVSP